MDRCKFLSAGMIFEHNDVMMEESSANNTSEISDGDRFVDIE